MRARVVRGGARFTPVAGVDNSLTGVGLDRPNIVGTPYVRNTSKLLWLSPGAFTPNSPVRNPFELIEMCHVGLRRNSGGSVGTNRRSSAIRSSSLRTGLKMST